MKYAHFLALYHRVSLRYLYFLDAQNYLTAHVFPKNATHSEYIRLYTTRKGCTTNLYKLLQQKAINSTGILLFFFRFMKMLTAILIIMIRQEILSKTKFLWEIMSASRRPLCADA